MPHEPHEDTLAAQFYIELRHLYQDVARITEQKLGMSQTRMEILHELYHVEEMSQAELQRLIGVEGPVITRIVKQLESAGLVTRRPDPRDNRFTLVALTPQTRQATRGSEGTQFKDDVGEQLMAGLDAEEQATLLRLMRRVQENAQAMRKAKPGEAQHTHTHGDSH